MPEMTLDTISEVTLLGPESNIAKRLNSKVYQYTHLKKSTSAGLRIIS
jgi:hypothetical protein